MKIPGKWIIACVYTIGIFIVTPFLPQLIRVASSQWSKSSVANFVLGVEIIIALLILGLAISFLIYRKKKSILFFIFTGGLFEYNFADSEITMLFLYMITIPFSLARIQRKDDLKEKKLLK